MDDIRYWHNRVIYVSCPCVLGLALRNFRNIFILQMVLVVLAIITQLKLRWISVWWVADSYVNGIENDCLLSKGELLEGIYCMTSVY